MLSFSVSTSTLYFHYYYLLFSYLLLQQTFLLCYCDGKVDEREKGNLRKRLRHYEFVTGGRRQLVKRGVNNPNPTNYNRIEQYQFDAFGKTWKLYLTMKSGLLHRHFLAELGDDLNGSSRRQRFQVDPAEFYTGHVFGLVNSSVSANFDADGAITALIRTDEDTILLEPAWRHIDGRPLHDSLAYRLSDLIIDVESHHHLKVKSCAYIDTNDSNLPINDTVLANYFRDYGLGREHSEPVIERRQRRQASPVKNRCPVKLVGDYSFYTDIAGSNAANAAKYLVGVEKLISVMDRVNDIFINTEWDTTGTESLINQGMIIKDLLIHTSPTPVNSSMPIHYNMARRPGSQPWVVQELLDAFSVAEGSPSYCLVHLFTAQSFGAGILGLGYIASPKVGTAGGVCSAASPRGGGTSQVYFNTALSSLISTYGDVVITREADIVTAHEFGHNWGSPHDPSGENEECSPSLKNGGSFIMHTYSVSGYDPNNKLFSLCSKNSIKPVIESKSAICFQEDVEQFCGNQRIENVNGLDPEQCDAGLMLGDAEQDRCCTPLCKLRPGALCSPKNHPCCTESCQFKPANTQCQMTNNNTCTGEARCNGYSGECPAPDMIADQTPCIEGGECQRGVCVSFCEKLSINQKPCICRNETQSCYRCCRLNATAECLPYSDSVNPLTQLADGTRCFTGYCAAGKCKKGAQDVINRLWDIIETIDSSKFWIFVQRNLVMVVVIVSLIFWIPAALLVNYIDQKRDEEHQQQLNIMDTIIGNQFDYVRDGKWSAL